MMIMSVFDVDLRRHSMHRTSKIPWTMDLTNFKAFTKVFHVRSTLSCGMCGGALLMRCHHWNLRKMRIHSFYLNHGMNFISVKPRRFQWIFPNFFLLSIVDLGVWCGPQWCRKKKNVCYTCKKINDESRAFWKCLRTQFRLQLQFSNKWMFKCTWIPLISRD